MQFLGKIPATAVVFSLNEAANIAECIHSLREFESVVVIDSGSTDGTLDICHKLGVRVVSFKWNGLYPKKRQWTLENVEFYTTWIFFVDADERCTPKLSQELEKLINRVDNNFAAAKIKLDYYFCGKKLRFGHTMWKTVLLDPRRARFPSVDDLSAKGMGELEGHYQPQIFGRTIRIKSKLIHKDNDPLDSWVERHIRYANWEAYLISRPEVRGEVIKYKSRGERFLKLNRFQGLLYFIYAYILRLGFLDGRAGFNFAFGKSWYYWLISALAREGRTSK